MLITGTRKNLGDGFTIQRLVPTVACRSVGPWVFLDHFGPMDVSANGMAVRPHPHIGLATVTYLYAGEVRHRDSVGSDVVITPGAVNLMTAGRGITHSERSEGYRGELHGLQLWLALPEDQQDCAPSFHHEPASAIPAWTTGGLSFRLLMGTLDGRTSGVPSRSPTLFVDLTHQGGTFEIPVQVDELAIMPITSGVWVNGERVEQGQMWVGKDRASLTVRGEGAGRLALLGGRSLGRRKMFWNFVHTRAEAIEAAKKRWRQNAFPRVPGDDQEFIPLP